MNMSDLRTRVALAADVAWSDGIDGWRENEITDWVRRNCRYSHEVEFDLCLLMASCLTDLRNAAKRNPVYRPYRKARMGA